MNMFGEMLGGLVDKEQMTRDTIQDALEKIAIELKCSYKDFFIMIRPNDDEFNHSYYVCKYDDKGNPTKVRQITLKEILSSDKED